MKYLGATIKSADRGGFDAVASAPTLDRDGEVIAAGAFAPPPSALPLLVNHKRDEDPAGRVLPRYVGRELHVRGEFASTARGQEVRAMVLDGALAHTSVGFIGAKYEPQSKPPTIIAGELIEVSLVAIPSNRDSRVLAARAYDSADAVNEARQLAVDVALHLARADVDSVIRDDMFEVEKMLAQLELDDLAERDPMGYARRILRDLEGL